MDAGWTKLVVDLANVSSIDSAGIGALISGLKRSREAGGDLRIACATPQPRLVLRLTSLTNVLPVYSTVEDALAEFNLAK